MCNNYTFLTSCVWKTAIVMHAAAKIKHKMQFMKQNAMTYMIIAIVPAPNSLELKIHLTFSSAIYCTLSKQNPSSLQNSVFHYTFPLI